MFRRVVLFIYNITVEETEKFGDKMLTIKQNDKNGTTGVLTRNKSKGIDSDVAFTLTTGKRN